LAKFDLQNLEMMKFASVLFLLLALPASAIKLAVLEIIPSDEEIELSINETRFLTDELRRRMIYGLPQSYTVFTREQILALIPSDAEDLTTAISIGKAIKSDFVTQGSVGKLGGSYALTIELYECNSGFLLGDIVKTAPNLEGLIEAIRNDTPRLAGIVAERGPFIESAEMDRDRLNEEIDLQIARGRTGRNAPLRSAATAADEDGSIPANINLMEKLNTPTLIAISLDFLGVAMLGYGIYQNSKAKDFYEKSQELVNDAYSMNLADYEKKKIEFESARSDMKSAESSRSFGLIVGSLLLAAGISIHIWF
jgi:hypothetical protein